MRMKNIPAFEALLSTPKNIVITVHQRPDADALGTGLGLAALLKKQHHQVQVIAPTAYPAFLDWMPGASEVIICAQGQQERSFDLLKKAVVGHGICAQEALFLTGGEPDPDLRGVGAHWVVVDR